MGCWYSLDGKIRVKDTRKVNEILAELHQELPSDIEIEFDRTVAGEITVNIQGGSYMSYSLCTELDDIIQSLGPYTIEPAMVKYEYEGSAGELYVGPENTREAKESAASLEKIEGLLADLTDEDREKLINMMMDHNSKLGS